MAMERTKQARSSRLRACAAALLAIVFVLTAGPLAQGQQPPTQQPSAAQAQPPPAHLQHLVAQSQPPPAQQALPTADYLLGPGDVLEVSVWGYNDLTRLVAVRPDGKISLPLVGEVAASGVSVERLTQVLTRAFAVYIRTPQVTVILKEFRRIQVSILGQVARPGTYALPPDARLIDLLAVAGGLTEVAALAEAQLLQAGKPPVRIDLERLLRGDPAVNVALTGGETLVIPEDLVNIVNVIGEVARPGRYRLKGEMRVLDALLLAGGLTEKASVTQARIVRGRDSHLLGLDSLLLRQEMSRNVPLHAGDTLIVPEETNNKVYVLGDVNRPGVYVLQGDVTLLQAIAMAGGPVQRGPATARSINIVRRNGGDDRRLTAAAGMAAEPLPNGGTLISVDLQTMLRGNPAGRDLAMQAGDVVVVTQSGLIGFQMVLSILTSIFWFVK